MALALAVTARVGDGFKVLSLSANFTVLTSLSHIYSEISEEQGSSLLNNPPEAEQL
jgi:hypothetical protein